MLPNTLWTCRNGCEDRADIKHVFTCGVGNRTISKGGYYKNNPNGVDKIGVNLEKKWKLIVIGKKKEAYSFFLCELASFLFNNKFCFWTFILKDFKLHSLSIKHRYSLLLL